jgi:hypothetical protein
MGTINVEGIGTVQIQGAQPTPEEARTILKAVEAKKLEKQNTDAMHINNLLVKLT